MEYKLQFLTCGYNGTGCSSLLSIEYSKRYSSESFVENRILINAGDSTQRICSEHRIKLSKVSTVIISSLAPHNVSGFASVFLSLSDLGVGELTVYGPSGLKSLIDVMTPLINRRYPVLKAVEIEEELTVIGGLWNTDKEEFKTCTSRLKLLPVYSSKSSSKSIAIAARLDFINSSSQHTIAYIPVGYYFNMHPNLDTITRWGFEVSENSSNSKLSKETKRTAVFVPLGVMSHINQNTQIDLEFGASIYPSKGYNNEEHDHCTELMKLCVEFDLYAYLYPNELTNSCFEFRHAQRTINKLNTISSDLFPRAIYENQSCSGEVTRDKHQQQDASSGSLLYVYPMLELSHLMTVQIKESNSDYNSGKSATRNLLPLQSFIEVTTQEKERVVKILENMVPLPSSSSTIATISTFTSTITMLNSPQLTNLAASFKEETSIHKPNQPSLSESQSSSTNRWESTENYNAAQALRDKLFSNKRKHSQGKNVVTSISTIISDDCVTRQDNADSTGLQCNEVGDSLENMDEDNKFTLEPRQKRMQRKPSSDVVISYPWSPKIDNANSSCDVKDSEVHSTHFTTVPKADSQNDLFQVYFLGTGCATPSKHRNNSCIMISLKGNRNYMSTLPPPNHSEEVPTLTLPTAPILTVPPPPMLTIPTDAPSSSSFKSSLSLNIGLCNNEVADISESGNPFASKFSRKSALALDIDTDPVRKSNPFATNKGKPGLSLDLGLCGSDSVKPSSRRPSGVLSLDLSLCTDQGQSRTASPTVGKSSTNEIENETLEPIILFDVGEGTASQLFQLVNGNIERYDEYLLRIRVIWISHHHADHTTGLPMLLEQIHRAQMRQRKKLSKSSRCSDYSEEFCPGAPPSLPSLITKYDVRRNRHNAPSPGFEVNKIMLIASEQLLQFYEYAAAAAGLEELLTYNSISNSLYAGLTREMRHATNFAVKRLQSVPVQHCQSAFGVVLELMGGQKIVFSGDCRPSQSLVKCGMNCDLLIHEATFTDERVDHAMKKRHSTFSEAVDIGRRMGAKHIILTHFSQRYPMTLLTSPAGGNSSVIVQSVAESEAIASNPPSLGSSGNMFSTTGSYNGLRRSSKTNIFNTTSPPKPPALISSTSFSDVEGSYIDDRGSLVSSSDIPLNTNVAIAYDFLGFSFPSQIGSLPEATSLVANVFSAMDELEDTDEDKE